jgi:uncharacterized protein with NRDE domain
MCLLIAAFQMVPDTPLIIAANRDERMDRPAVAITVLRENRPRILGGRDELAGGTWLAVNQHGLVAGLTNQPSPEGRDPTKLSRGELPLAFAGYQRAEPAVSEVSERLDPSKYNPCWMLIGDRDALFSVGLAGAARPHVQRLGPGLHILENAPLQPESPKAAYVRRLVADAAAAPTPAAAPAPAAGTAPVTAARMLAILEDVLRIHQPALTEPRVDATGRTWPAAISAPCVHTEGYGTRSAMTVVVPAVSDPPGVRVADGRPCETPFRDVTAMWSENGHTAALGQSEFSNW